MMQFSRNGEWYQVIRITGPAQNLLALKFDESSALDPVVERLSVDEKVSLIEAGDVKNQVLKGVSDANSELGTTYKVAAIRFVSTDTPSSDIYHRLAKVIVEHVTAT